MMKPVELAFMTIDRKWSSFISFFEPWFKNYIKMRAKDKKEAYEEKNAKNFKDISV